MAENINDQEPKAEGADAAPQNTPPSHEPQGDSKEPDSQGVTEPGDSKEPESVDSLKAALEANNKKIAELEKDNKKYRDQRAKAQKEQEERDREAAEKKGEYENLYNDFKSKYENIEPEYSKYKDTVASMYKAELDSLPHQEKDKFVDLFGDLEDPLILLQKLQKWRGTLQTLSTPDAANKPPSRESHADKEKIIKADMQKARAEGDVKKANQLYRDLQLIHRQKMA